MKSNSNGFLVIHGPTKDELKKLHKKKLKDYPVSNKKWNPEEALEYYRTNWPDENWWYEKERNICVSSGNKAGSLTKSVGLINTSASRIIRNGFKHSDIYGKKK